MKVIAGGNEAFAALVFGQQNPNNQQYFQNEINTLKNFAGSVVDGFVERANQAYHMFNNANVKAIAQAALNQVRGFFVPNVITRIDTLAGLQTAGTVMQRWIMACPEVREVYHKQQCDGYSDSYHDKQPGKVGYEQYDYSLVMEGIVQTDDKGRDFSIQTVQDLAPGDSELEFAQQTSILQTWELTKHFMRMGQKDPTSPWNTDL